MDTPNDDEKLGPDDLNLNLNPSQPSGEEKITLSHGEGRGEASKGISLPTDEQLLQRIQNDLNNKLVNKMADEKIEPKTEKVEKPSKKTEDSLPVVKKDYTALIIAIGALLIAIGFYAWQNYQKRKDDENTIDSKFTDLGKENETFNDQRTYE